MENNILMFGVLSLLLVGCVSAYSVDFFYSEQCGHCYKVYPIVNGLSSIYKINFLDINKGSYNIQRVPLIKIKTNDCRELELGGSQEIPRWLECELSEQTTKECPTYSGKINPETQSWFIR